MDLLNLNSFLKLGYFLKYQNPTYSIDLSGIDKSLYKDWQEEDLIQMGIRTFREAIESYFELHRKHVVPISGGLDSRGILAVLLEFTEAQNISTYTYGTPKTYDYEIGNLIAKETGTKHTSFPMTKTNYQLNELIDLSKRFHHQSVLFYHPPIHKIDEMFIDHIVWSGFAGGPITGLAISKKPAITLDEAKEHFFHKALIQSNHLMNCPVEDLFPLIEWDGFNQDHLSFEEQLDLRNRQLKYIAPHLLYPGVEYKLPYLYPKFFDFVMSLPEQYRIEQYLFRNIMMRYYPTLFQIPTKRIWGLPLTAGRFRRICRIFRLLGQKEINRVISLFVDPNINYINFTQGIRERKNLKMIIFESIHDLKSRKIIDWIDFERLWKEHMYKKRDHSMALILLASLEIHLKAGKKL